MAKKKKTDSNALTFEEKCRMADIYSEADLRAPNPKSFNKYRSAWYKKR